MPIFSGYIAGSSAGMSPYLPRPTVTLHLLYWTPVFEVYALCRGCHLASKPSVLHQVNDETGRPQCY